MIKEKGIQFKDSFLVIRFLNFRGFFRHYKLIEIIVTNILNFVNKILAFWIETF